jgi:hypothetical protein
VLVAEEPDEDAVVLPLPRGGGPGEYMAAAEPGREAGSGNNSGLMYSPFIPRSGNIASVLEEEGRGGGRAHSSEERASVSLSASLPSAGRYAAIAAAADDLFLAVVLDDPELVDSEDPGVGSGFRIFLFI